eukprot:scaffold886_cov249-Pinguiococcus_pyrenoidosus.AAC.3
MTGLPACLLTASESAPFGAEVVRRHGNRLDEARRGDRKPVEGVRVRFEWGWAPKSPKAKATYLRS